jgi:hypothetical protein
LVDSAVTGTDGSYWFAGLVPGATYIVEEDASSLGFSWTNVTPTTVALSDVANNADLIVNFANRPLTSGSGRGTGYWRNSNGQATLNDDGGAAAELALLDSLNLTNYDGTFDTLNEFTAWLGAANSGNMSYKLSAQLAALALNIEAGFVNE